MDTEHEPHALTSQVGGHAGVLTSEDESLIIKPASTYELEFYQLLQQSPDLALLRPFTPKFFGTLKLEGKLDESQPAVEGSISIKPSIVLQNLSHTFLKPNIIDIKLGTVLYEKSASPEKIERMLKTARETTSLETGIRLTGFQVHDNVTGEAVNTPKSYGKSIKPSDLPEGTRRIYPVGDGNSTSGLPLSTLLPIMNTIRRNVQEIRDAYEKLEIRMVGGSLLIVYEADWERAEAGLPLLDVLEDEEDDESDDDEEEDKKKIGPPCIVKLIDFAHTHLVPGEGPDDGVLLGMNTVLKLLDGRIAELTSN